MSAADIQLRARIKVLEAAINGAVTALQSIIDLIEGGGTLAIFQEFETRADMLASTIPNITFATTRNNTTGDGVLSTWVASSNGALANEVTFNSDVWESTGVPGRYFLRIATRIP